MRPDPVEPASRLPAGHQPGHPLGLLAGRQQAQQAAQRVADHRVEGAEVRVERRQHALLNAQAIGREQFLREPERLFLHLHALSRQQQVVE